MDERPEQPAEGKLISDALAESGLSIREASRRAGISYGRWRQIASGAQNASPGSWAKVVGPAKTVARMAVVVGVSADEMATAGREDVAAILREERPPLAAAPREARWESFTEDEQRIASAFIATLRRSREEGDDRKAGSG